MATPPARSAVQATSISHAVMVALMGMTPLRLMGHGATLSIVGLILAGIGFSGLALCLLVLVAVVSVDQLARRR